MRLCYTSVQCDRRAERERGGWVYKALYISQALSLLLWFIKKHISCWSGESEGKKLLFWIFNKHFVDYHLLPFTTFEAKRDEMTVVDREGKFWPEKNGQKSSYNEHKAVESSFFLWSSLRWMERTRTTNHMPSITLFQLYKFPSFLSLSLSLSLGETFNFELFTFLSLSLSFAQWNGKLPHTHTHKEAQTTCRSHNEKCSLHLLSWVIFCELIWKRVVCVALFNNACERASVR
jgi:hypothetical protein